MRWSNDLRPRYSLHFEGPDGRPPRDGQVRSLISDTLDDAKFEAAILYAAVDPAVLPQAYRIVKGARRVVYRYPESPSRV